MTIPPLKRRHGGLTIDRSATKQYLQAHTTRFSVTGKNHRWFDVIFSRLNDGAGLLLSHFDWGEISSNNHLGLQDGFAVYFDVLRSTEDCLPRDHDS